MVLAPSGTGAYQLPRFSQTAASSGRLEVRDNTNLRGPSLWGDHSVEERLALLKQIEDGWDGEGAPAPSAASLRTAREFWSCTAAARPVTEPSVGPATDGGVVLEWDLDGGRSVYCYARDDKVTVAAFDQDKDYVELALPAVAAGLLAGVLLAVPAWS